MFQIDPTNWQIIQVIAIDWHDGAQEGFCWLKEPSMEFYFNVVDYRVCSDDLDDRIYLAREIPSGSCRQLIEAMKGIGSPTERLWSPIWQHPDQSYLEAVEKYIDMLIQNASAPILAIYTKDMQKFLRCWRLEGKDAAVDDWFSYLNIQPCS